MHCCVNALVGQKTRFLIMQFHVRILSGLKTTVSKVMISQARDPTVQIV